MCDVCVCVCVCVCVHVCVRARARKEAKQVMAITKPAAKKKRSIPLGESQGGGQGVWTLDLFRVRAWNTVSRDFSPLGRGLEDLLSRR